MFPSGRWRGYWVAMGWGRRDMEPLTLRFSDGKVTGEGVDCVGRFTFEGTYSSDGHVRLLKQYIGRHQVDYQGRVDGEGAVVGRWNIDRVWNGPFMLVPVIESVADLPIATLKARPPGEGDEVPSFLPSRIPAEVGD